MSYVVFNKKTKMYFQRFEGKPENPEIIWTADKKEAMQYLSHHRAHGQVLLFSQSGLKNIEFSSTLIK